MGTAEAALAIGDASQQSFGRAALRGESSLQGRSQCEATSLYFCAFEYPQCKQPGSLERVTEACRSQSAFRTYIIPWVSPRIFFSATQLLRASKSLGSCVWRMIRLKSHFLETSLFPCQHPHSSAVLRGPTWLTSWSLEEIPMEGAGRLPLSRVSFQEKWRFLRI